MLRIALVQMCCEKAAAAQNLAFIETTLVAAEAHKIDIVAFPEMCIAGYADPTRYPQSIMRLDGPAVAQLLSMTRGLGLTALVGLIEENDGQKPFITQIAVHDGSIVGVYRKRSIEDEELEWFSAGDVVPVLDRRGLRYSMAICADVGNKSVFRDGALGGARIIFEMAAPGLYGAQETRDWASGFCWWEGVCQEALSRYAVTYGVWIAVATQAGRTIDEDFPGGGYLFAPDGRRVFATEDGASGTIYLEIDLERGLAREL